MGGRSDVVKAADARHRRFRNFLLLVLSVASHVEFGVKLSRLVGGSKTGETVGIHDAGNICKLIQYPKQEKHDMIDSSIVQVTSTN